MTFDSSGNLYASNFNGSIITEFNSRGAFVKSISSNLNGPFGVAFDSSGNLYASNFNNNTISVFTPAAVPWEFSANQGILLGFPFFLGLRVLKKRKLRELTTLSGRSNPLVSTPATDSLSQGLPTHLGMNSKANS